MQYNYFYYTSLRILYQLAMRRLFTPRVYIINYNIRGDPNFAYIVTNNITMKMARCIILYVLNSISLYIIRAIRNSDCPVCQYNNTYLQYNHNTSNIILLFINLLYIICTMVMVYIILVRYAPAYDGLYNYYCIIIIYTSPVNRAIAVGKGVPKYNTGLFLLIYPPPLVGVNFKGR